MSRLVALAVLPLLLAAGPAARAERVARAETVVVVPANGTAATTFATTAGSTYALTVSGTYAYDANGGLADCGHRDVNGAVAAQNWVDTPGLLVDGAPVSCGYYSDLHTYSLHVVGTGRPLAFAVPADPTGYADNTGALTVTVVTDTEIDGRCEYDLVAVPTSSAAYFVVAAEGHQSGTGSAGTYTRVECALFVGGTRVATADEQALAPAVAAVETTGAVPLTGPVSACLTVTVLNFLQEEVAARAWPCT